MAYPIVLFRLFALIGLAASTALAADSLGQVDTLCPFEGDCAQVAASDYSRIFGIPLFAVGVVGFAAFLALTFVTFRRASNIVRASAVAAGIAGAALLAIQFAVIRRMCPLCVVADSSALGIAVVAIVRRPEGQCTRLQVGIWSIALFVAVVTPVFLMLARLPEPIPDKVREQWVPGAVTIVEVTDFDCQHCQRADAVMREVLPRPNVRLVRLVAPMPAHENAWPAARAYLAAKRQGRGEEMARVLFAADTRSPKACRRLAADLGLDLSEFDRALEDPAIGVELRDTVAWAKSAGTGLPLIWVQDQFVPGVLTAGALEAAITRAESSSR